MSGSTNNNTPAFNLRCVLEKDKLNANNFLEWEMAVRIVLRAEGRESVLDTPLPEPLPETATVAEKRARQNLEANSVQVTCLMLACMEHDFQKRFNNLDAYTIIQQLRTMFEKNARLERFEANCKLLECKLGKGKPVGPHVFALIGHFQVMEKLGFPYPKELATDIVIRSLPETFDAFRLNFYMQGGEATLPELHGMLVQAERSLPSEPALKDVLMVRKNKKFKKKGAPKWNGNGKVVTTNDSSKPKATPKAKVAALHECYHCHKIGHWKRNCPVYLEEKKSGALSSGIYVIEINLATSASWVFDTACGSHITSNVQGLKRSRSLSKGEVDLRVGNGARVAALAVGVYILTLPSGLILELNNCYYVPAITKNIISIPVLDTEGFSFTIKNNCCSAYLNDMFYVSAKLLNGLYVLDLETHIYNIDSKKRKTNDSNPTYLWHCRLGHISSKRIEKLHKDGILKSFDFESFGVCEFCLMGKMTKSPFTGTSERANDLLALIHTDVCGPMSTVARGGYSYFITFTDDVSRYGYVYLMRHKSESFEKFKEFQNEVENQLGKKIKALRSDRGGEYLSHEFDDHLKNRGILSQLTPPGTPQLNGVSERRNRTLLDMVRSVMSLADLPISFWGFALDTAAFTLNRAPTKAVEKTPYEMWTGKVPKLSFLRIWGCEAYVKRLISDKLAPKSDKCLFVGYPKKTKGYYFYNQSENKVFVARNGVFLEQEFISRKTSGSNVYLEEVRDEQQMDKVNTSSEAPQHDNAQEEMHSTHLPPTAPSGENPREVTLPNEAETSLVVPLRKSSRTIIPSRRYIDFLLTENSEITMLESEEPTSHKDALESPDSEKWLEAMKSEMDSMSENQVWDLVDLPDGVKPIGCKWIFKLKTDKDGNISVFKARLVAKGFKQIHGIDYDETFSPVAMLKSIRIILAIAAFHDFEIWQMDVKTAFLNGFLKEDVYMTQPQGFEDPKNPRKVCKLKRSIYGLKQASRSWNLRFDEAVKEFGFLRNEEESCVYKKLSGSNITFLVLYVDDILLIGNDKNILESVKQWLKSHFSMKDLGEAEYILGIKIYRDRSRRLIGLNQETYIDKILTKFKMESSKRGFIPMQHGIKLCKTMCPSSSEEFKRMNNVPYASAIGSIMYAMICTRPDVAFALSMCSRYQSNPGDAHWIAAKNILKYLRRTKDKFLVYGGANELFVTGYTDASFQTDKDDFRSQSGFIFCLNGGAVSWKSSKQSSVADSTTEAEYIAAAEAAKEAVWIKKFVSELGVVPSIENGIKLYCDNEGAIAQSKEPRSHQKSKHVERKFHLIREIVGRQDVIISRVDTTDNIADPLTKPLPQPKHESHTRSMGLKHIGECL